MTIEEARELRELTSEIAENLRQAREHWNELPNTDQLGELVSVAGTLSSNLKEASNRVSHS